MSTLHFRVTSAVMRPLPVVPVEARFEFEVPADTMLARRVQLVGPVRLIVVDCGANVLAACTVAVPPTMRSRLEMGEHVSNLNPLQFGIWQTCLNILETAIRQTVELLSQELGAHESLAERPSAHLYQWSGDGENWSLLSVQRPPLAIAFTSDTSLNADTHAPLRTLVASGAKALTASRFVTLARASESPQVKTILSAVAAEIGIKEGLISLDPSLETELTSRNTPRVGTLFGEYLKRVTGSASSHAGDIQTGADVRNALVHSSRATLVDGLEAEQYLNVVEHALIDLRRRIRHDVVATAPRAISVMQNAIPAPVTPDDS